MCGGLAEASGDCTPQSPSVTALQSLFKAQQTRNRASSPRGRRIGRAVDTPPVALPTVRFAAYLIASILGAVLLGLAGLCAVAAGRNHLSPWWVPAYASLLTAFALIAETTVPGLGIS